MIVMYVGRRGAGKTTAMIKDALNYHSCGWRVITNMESVPFADEVVDSMDVIQMIDREDVNDCVLVLDEIQTIIDSRRSASKHNVSFSNFIQQIRKRNIIVIATTQFFDTADKRFRAHTDVLAYPSKEVFDDGTMVITVKYVDRTAMDVLEGVGMVSFIANDVWNYFDTNELHKNVVKPVYD